jgi:hypothetical protein
MSIREMITKANTANIVAATILIGTLIYSIWARDAEMLRYLAPFAAGYLFGRATRGG